MPIEVGNIKSLLGDRILVKPLSRPERKGSLMLPASALNAKGKQSEIWFGIVEALGRDARYPDAYGINVGDVIGVEFLGRQCETLTGNDGEEHCWVAEEFIAAKSTGRVEAFNAGLSWKPGTANQGLEPVGSYVLVRPAAEEEKRGGIHIPHNAREAQKMGTSIAASVGEIRAGQIDGLHVDVGVSVLFGRYSGSWVKLDEELLLMKQEDIIAVMEPAKEVANVK